MNKWKEYANNDTDFPIVWIPSECGDFYDAEYVQDWLKRCIADFPRILAPDQHRSGNYSWVNPEETVKWFNKWFSQFEKNSEE